MGPPVSDSSNWEELQECSVFPTGPGRRGRGPLWSQTQIISGWTWAGQAWGLRTKAEETVERMERISPGAGVAGEGVLLRGMSGPVGSASGVR